MCSNIAPGGVVAVAAVEAEAAVVAVAVVARSGRGRCCVMCSCVPYAEHRRSTMPCMRLMWLFEEQMNWNRHSTGGWRSMRAPMGGRVRGSGGEGPRCRGYTAQGVGVQGSG